MDVPGDGEWRRDLAVALIEGGADTDAVVRAVARALLATDGRAPTRASGVSGPAPAAGETERERILGLLGACAAVEALECQAYNRPVTWPLLERAVAAVEALEAALAAAGPASWEHYATE